METASPISCLTMVRFRRHAARAGNEVRIRLSLGSQGAVGAKGSRGGWRMNLWRVGNVGRQLRWVVDVVMGSKRVRVGARVRNHHKETDAEK